MPADTSVAKPPHLVLLLRHALYLRNYESTVRQLADDGWKITIATLDGSRSVDGSLSTSLADEHPLVECAQLPRARGVAQEGLEASYTALDWLRYLDARYQRATALQDRAERRVTVSLRWALGVYGVRRNTRRRMRSTLGLRHVSEAAPVSRTVLRALRKLEPTVLAVSPLVDIGGGQHPYLRAAQKMEVPSALLVASWDNLTNKGLIHIVPDKVAVWNRLQAEEAFRLHDVPRERIVTTGAQLFDWLRAPAQLPSRERFLNSLGLDPTKKTILYVGSSSAIGVKEGAVLTDVLIPAIRSHWDPEIAGSNIIVRRHPTNPLASSRTAATFRKHAVVEDPLAGEAVVDDVTRMHYRALLTHADVVIGVNTSAFLEAAVVGTPSIPITARKLSSSQQQAPHFRMLVDVGLFEAPRSIHGALAKVSDALHHPDRTRGELDAFVEKFVDPPAHFDSATQALVDSISDTAKASPTPRRRHFSVDAIAILLLLGVLSKADKGLRKVRRGTIVIASALRARMRRPAGPGSAERKTSSAVEAREVDQSAGAPGLPEAAGATRASDRRETKLTAEDRIRISRRRHRDKTILAFKIDAYRMIWGPNRYGALRRALRRVRKLVFNWLRTVPGIAHTTPDGGRTASVVYKHVTRPVLAARSSKGAQERVHRLRAELAAAAKTNREVVFGPWTSEVGFELLYWVPFVRRLVAESGLRKSQLTIISRGGTSGWYGIDGAKYRDVFQVLGAAEFRERFGEARVGKKQTEWTPAEEELRQLFAPADALVVHPSEMYLALMPYFAGHVAISWLDGLLEPAATGAGSASRQWDAVRSRLPANYVAVSLYRRPSFDISPDDAQLSSLLQAAREAGLPLVSLETGLILDDHRPIDLRRVWMSRPLLGVDPAINLDLQTRVISGASGLIATYGGTSYLGGLLGVPTLALYEDPRRILWHHLDVARARFEESAAAFEVADLQTCNPESAIAAFARVGRPTVSSEEVA